MFLGRIQPVMAKAIWEGTTLAESDRCVVVEGNHYFPPDSVRTDLLQPSALETVCPWKGKASYYNVIVAGKTNANAAWYYPHPHAAAREIKGHVAFWKGVTVER